MTKRRADAPALADLVAAAKGLAHPTRLRLLGMLAGGELCVCQLTAILALAPSTVSQHLSVLARGRLVAERKTGKLVFYRLADDGMAAGVLSAFVGALAGDATAQADARLVSRLRRVPVATLCAAELDLAAVGVEPAAGSASTTPGRRR